MTKLFGTDGVRGLAGAWLTPELAFELGKAGAYVLTKTGKHTPQIIVGKDTRRSGDMLEAALTAGMCSVGAVVHHAGIVPTPCVAFAVRRFNFDAGIVISASHNAFADNGIKFFGANGHKLSDAVEAEIERCIADGVSKIPNKTGTEIGFCATHPNILRDYAEFLLSCVPNLNLTGMRIALDTANGATGVVAEAVFKRTGAEIFVLNNTPNGININAACGSTHTEALCDFVKHNQLDIGIAFDGDGDRCLLVDECGNLLDGDQIMSICATAMQKNGTLKQNTLVATVMSNFGLTLMGKQNNIRVEQTRVGDRYVLEHMLENNFNLGGEQSGHVIFLDHNTTGDGLLTALKTLAFIREQNLLPSKAARVIQIFPQVLKNVPVSDAHKHTYLKNSVLSGAISKIEQNLKGTGRILIRPSGTEPLIRIMLEGEDLSFLQAQADHLACLFAAQLQ
jgi:phosphoglucosamine mutase